MRKPFAAVATQLETGERTVFVRGNTGQAVRASSSIPGVFEPVAIGKFHYVDGGVVSPVPVDAARQLGADFVIAVDISSKASGKNPGSVLGNINQSITIMGQQLGQQELARADVVIRPQRAARSARPISSSATTRSCEGERAALAAMPQIRAKLAQMQKARVSRRRQRGCRKPVPVEPVCKDEGFSFGKLVGRGDKCEAVGAAQ